MWFKQKKAEVDPGVVLAELLSKRNNQEDLLGVSNTHLPSPQELMTDATRLLKYSHDADYQVFAKEAWARVITELDKILDPRTSVDQIQNSRGALRATLDLLRLSYQARFAKEGLEKEQSQNASLAR